MTSLLSASVLAFPAAPALATPHPSAQQIQSKLKKLNNKADHVVDDYNQARVDLKKSHKAYKKLDKKVKVDGKKVARMRGRIAMMATVAYQSGNRATPVAMMASGDPQHVLDQMASLSHLSASQTASIKRFLTSSSKLRHDRSTAKSKLKLAKKALAKQRTKRSEVEKLVKKQKSLLRALPPSQQPKKPTSTGGTYKGSASGSARSALSFAYAQLGKPYVFGSAGPNSYDCSGLMVASWKAAGVTLPRTSQAQYNFGHHVSQSQLQPGDLVFFNGLGHVGMYIGNGKVIHAPHTGSVVNILPFSAMASSYVGAVRP